MPIEEMRLLWRQHPIWRRILGKELDAAEHAPADAKGNGGANGALFVKGDGHVDAPQEAGGHASNGKPWKAAV